MLGRGVEIVLAATLAPRLVIACEILLEDELAVTGDDHGVNVGLGLSQPGGDGAQPRAIEAGAFGGIDNPAVAECRGGATRRVCLAQRLRSGRGECEEGNKTEAPQFLATLVHAAVSVSRYAGGGTEIFTDCRSSIF